jgi:tetratricopeptide (TPR) repeat protein
MKKFAGILVVFLVLFLVSSNMWAGDSEIRTEPTDSVSLPLTEPEVEEPAMAEPEMAVPEETMVEAVEAVPEPEEVMTEAVAPEEMKDAAEEAVAEVEVPAVVVPPPPAPKDDLTIAAELIEMGGVDNYKKALDLCMAEAAKNPNNFNANWMAAQACRLYGMEAQELGLADWKDTCKLYGKKGMAYAEKAIALNPERPEGYHWYGMNVGIYADSVSILTALKEGLKDKTQSSFETAYKIDKYYDNAGPIAALGRFWAVLPWPLNDDGKALEYYREFQKTEFFATPDTVQVNVYIAELLMESRKTKEEARKLLEQVPKLSDNKYWNNKAKELLAEM